MSNKYCIWAVKMLKKYWIWAAVVLALLVVGVLLVVFLVKKSPQESSPDLIAILREPYGRVRGHVMKTASGKEFYAFQEIPYAQPPIGRHRFTLPKRHHEWHDIRDGTRNTKICMQTLRNNPYNLNITEDCLYLNIYTPMKLNNTNTDPDDGLPVLIWIHPGNFQTGGGVIQYYNPRYLMEYDMIVVTLNYRLGPFGFLWAGDEIIQGNIGLLDQFFVYNWLFKNIGIFGGNPWLMSFAGQGAGAASICYHFTSRRARETLFNTAILMSGSCISPTYYQPHPKKYAFMLAERLNKKNVSLQNTTELRDFLRSVPAKDILKIGNVIKKEEELPTSIFEREIWLPVAEGFMNKNPYIEWPTLYSWTTGNIRLVPIMIGFTSGEMTAWAHRHNISQLALEFDSDPSLLINSRIQIPPENRRQAGEEMRKLYTTSSFRKDKNAFIKFLNDQIAIPIIKHAYNSSWYNSNYLYQFSYKQNSTNITLGLTGSKDSYFSDDVAHAEELKFIWDDSTNPGKKFSDEDQLTQRRLLTMFTNFITYRNPTPTEDELFDNVKWKSTTDIDRLHQSNYLKIGTILKAGFDPVDFQNINDLIDKYINTTDPLSVF